MTTLLMDADSYIYSMGHKHETAFAWTPEIWSYKGDLGLAKDDLDRFIDWAMTFTGSTEIRVALSDAHRNFRKNILGTYKQSRLALKRPMLFKPLRDYLQEKYGAVIRPCLEGDDVISMWATELTDRVVMSIDKDLTQLSGKLLNPMREGEGVREITEDEADKFFYSQVLTGDQTDGYKGCPGVGPKTVEKLFANWDTIYDPWKEIIVPTYEKAGLSENVALEQARCAWLLRHEDYDSNSSCSRIRLWSPIGAEEWMTLG